MASLTVAGAQMSCGPDREANLDRAEALVRDAAAAGATLVLLPELFEGPYFPKDQDQRHFALAHPLDAHPTVERFAALARELHVVLPVSVFERAGTVHYNSVVMVDGDGSRLGVYRKSHIPDGPGYTEKFYFTPGDSGFCAWPTEAGQVGLAICWDQWFPEAARAMALAGAEILLYPTAIGSEPQDPTIDSSAAWRRVMQGHAVANVMPVVAVNRHGHEEALSGPGGAIDFYGTSFIAGPDGAIVAEAPRHADAVITATFDLDGIREQRAGWGLFRDRRPDLYGTLLTKDGRSAV
jgi:N-carbamoylputrescine amidase